MLKKIIACEIDVVDWQVLNLDFEVPDEEFDLMAAIRAAVLEYCQSEDGKDVYEGNCNSFNWGDFNSYISNEICARHGFQKIDSDSISVVVDFNEQLVAESELFPEI